jgi:hypothetical protein
MSERCGYAVTDSEGIEGPCDRPVVGWRWYQDCGHEDTLEAACVFHENEGGNRMHGLASRLAAVEALADERDVPFPDKFAFGSEANFIKGYRAHRTRLRAALASVPDADTQRDDEGGGL